MIKKHIDYLKDNPEGYWFKRKIYGFGWVPATRQGWFIIIIYVIFLVIIFKNTDSYSHSASDTLLGIVVPTLILTATLILIAYWKGESPRWQWGLPEKYK